MPIKGPQGGGGSGGKAGASDVRAGGAFFEILAKDQLTKTLDALQKRVTAFGAFMKRAGQSLMLGGAALGAGPLALLIGGTNRLADIGRLAREFEVPIEVMGRLQYAAEMAGVSVQDVMADTKGRFRDLLAAAPAVDPQQVRQATAAQKEFRDATIALQTAMMPLLSTVAQVLTRVSAFAKENAGLVRVLGLAAAGVFGLGLAFSAAGTAVSVVLAGVGLLAKAFTLLLSPLGLVATAVGGLTALWLTQSETGRRVAGELGEAFRAVGTAFSETWGGIADAVKAGDLEIAFKVLAAGVKTVFFTMLSALSKALSDFLKDAHRKIVALATVAGALGGGALGGRLGPVGLLVGAVGGGAGAGIAADRALEEIEAGLEGLAGRFAGRAGEAGKELGELRRAARRAAVAVAANPFAADPDLARRLKEGVQPFAAVKGNFNVASARQQFGYGDAVSQQTELQRQIADNTKKAAMELVNLANGLVFG